MLPSMATLLEQVLVRTRDVLQGRIDWKALYFRYVSFTAEFEELFDPRTNTGWNRRNVPHFGRVFLMLNYTEKTQNTYIQS